VVEFVVGVVVGASVAALLIIVIGPSRRVRAEHPLPRDVETQLLLGETPGEEPPEPQSPSVEDEPRHYGPNELAELRRLGNQKGRRRR
jgi:hypothetical protein